ncbi:Carbohydrate/purine kinase [Metarhizium album ARSEF 1941]|uniref:Carbohydrate/purine kinase n=1 Tax=Metarhizium album (strain ARSEF 1941) TaxID=1081103 RepID=A0A0B2WYC7_METAS|nr:Carbohydrate/purine kinase [Metarhizium album ARSEF 1941]KHN97850.1 Carbohydrate/purine kinase [Metarhizium album ARSEF 1941]
MASREEETYCRPQKADESNTTARIDFVTLGMLILDDIDFRPPTEPVRGVLGGAGTYSALGARLFSPPPLSRSVGWVVDKGFDFPGKLSSLIDNWDTGAVVRQDHSRLTTRGWNGYVDPADRRAFKYTTLKKRITSEDLTPSLLFSKSFHLICSPTRCQELITDIMSRRKALVTRKDSYTKPIFVWEPVPDLCTPDELLNCTNTLRLVDICSPNHAELAGFMGDDGLDPETGEVSTLGVERACEQLLASMPLQSYALVVRAGDKGCYIAKNGGRKRRLGDGKTSKSKKTLTHGALRPDTDMEALFAGLLQDENGIVAREEIELDPGLEKWVPAYHRDGRKVIDPTGGGNAFLGGLSVALARGERLENAVAWGSVSASFAIEQVGLPSLAVNEEGVETWNGEEVRQRLQAFQRRL